MKSYPINQYWLRFKKWFCINFKYLLLYLMLFTCFFLAWLIFINSKQITDIPLKVGGVLSVIGSGFTLFQFGYNNITTNKRRLYDLRYTAYKEILQLVEKLAETLHEELGKAKRTKVDTLCFNVSNQVNRINSAITEYDSHLFPKLKVSDEAIKFIELIIQISSTTISFKTEIFCADIMAYDELDIMNIDGDWFNSIAGYTDNLQEIKYHFYAKLREYLN